MPIFRSTTRLVSVPFPPLPIIELFRQGWALSELGVPALMAWLDKCRAQDSVAGTLKDPAIWAELYKKFLGADYFVKAGVAKK